jgi:hypothetical protein
MNNIKYYFQKFWPYLIPVVLFVLLSYIYFSPVLEGKDLQQMDNVHTKGMAQELVQYEKETGNKVHWTNSMFGGMPAYQIKGGTSQNVFYYIHSYLRMGMPYTTVAIVFVYLLCFYILMLSLGFDKWLSFVGSAAFAFASYNFIIIAAGHITKTYAIGYSALTLAGFLLTYNKKYWLGGILALLGLGLELAANHIQITYYLMITILVFVITKLVFAIREKELKPFFISSGIVTGAAVLAILPSYQQLAVTYEYGQETIRGKSELASGASNEQGSGLTKTYAMDWSYGKAETFTMMIPHVVGGASGAIGEDESSLKNVTDEYKQMVAQNNHYWGSQPFTSGPVYLGAIIIFLFFIGAFYYTGAIRWWLIIATILSIFLAWGRNFGGFNDFIFNYFPMYNKFRTVAMTLVIAGFTVPLLAMMGLKTVMATPDILKTKKWPFWVSLGLTGGLCLLFALFPKLFFSFITSDESKALLTQKQAQPEYAAQIAKFMDNLEIARISILKSDAWRSLGFILAGAGLLWVAASKKFKLPVVATLFAVLIIADLWSVDKRYLNNKAFVEKNLAEQSFSPSKANEFIMKDVDINYRVLNVATNPFTEVNTSYFHKSIGGYHGAKLRRYQDLIDSVFIPNINELRTVLSKTQRFDSINMTVGNMHALNMLNTKYLIYNPDGMPLINMYALGNAWFVQDFQIVKNAKEELAAVKNFNPLLTAIIDEKFAKELGGFKAQPFDTARVPLIKLIKYEPANLIYQINTKRDEFAVFSEIYYDKGWQAYLDQKPISHVRVNYILRGMKIPAGRHLLEFKFEPQTFENGGKISFASSAFVVLLILGAIGKGIWDLLKKAPKPIPVEEITKAPEIPHSDKKSKKK